MSPPSLLPCQVTHFLFLPALDQEGGGCGDPLTVHLELAGGGLEDDGIGAVGEDHAQSSAAGQCLELRRGIATLDRHHRHEVAAVPLRLRDLQLDLVLAEVR